MSPVLHTFINKDYALSDYASHHVTYSSGNKYRMTFHISQNELLEFARTTVPPDLIERGTFIEIAEFIKRNIEPLAWKRFIDPSSTAFWIVEHVEIQTDSQGYLVTVEYVDATFYAFEISTQQQSVRIHKFRGPGEPDYHLGTSYTFADIAPIVRSRIIGLRSDGAAEGVEIKVPLYQFNIEYYVSQRLWKDELRHEIFDVVGHVLDYEWAGFPPRTIFVDDLTVDARPASEIVRIRWKLLYRAPFTINEADIFGYNSSTGVIEVNEPWKYRWVYALDVGVLNPLGKHLTFQDAVALIEGHVYPLTNKRVIREPE